MYEHNLINLLLYITSIVLWKAVFFPWILIEHDIVIPTEHVPQCTLFGGESLGYFFSSVCGVSLTTLESGLSVIRFLVIVVAVLTTCVFVISNWHKNTVNFEKADKILCFIVSSIIFVCMAVSLVLWNNFTFNTLPNNHAHISYFGAGFVAFVVGLVLWCVVLLWSLISFFW